MPTRETRAATALVYAVFAEVRTALISHLKRPDRFLVEFHAEARLFG